MASRGAVKHEELIFMKISPEAKAPERACIDSAGYDLSSVEDRIILPGFVANISTGLVLFLPVGTYGQLGPMCDDVEPQLDVSAGSWNPNNHKIVHIRVRNYEKDNIIIRKGQKIAHIVCVKYIMPKLSEIQNDEDSDIKKPLKKRTVYEHDAVFHVKEKRNKKQ